VTINVAGDRLITLSGGGTQTIKSLVSAERLLVSNSSLSISTTLQISNTLTLNNDGSLQGGTYTATGGAGLTVYRGSLTGGVTVNAPISVPNVNGGQLTVSGGLILNDTLSVGDGGKSYYANLAFGDAFNTADQTLAGTGSVVFNAGYLFAPSGAGTLTISPGITIRGKNGTIAGGAVVNQGTIAADGTDQRIYLEPGTFTNRGAMSARNGGFLSVDKNWTNAAGASVTAVGGSTLHLGTAGSSYPWSNAGTITATDSYVYLGGSFTQAGLGNFVRSGGTVYVTGTLSGGLALNAATGS
jgi:hypothetical protein